MPDLRKAATVTDLSKPGGLANRVAAGVRFVITGKGMDYFGPGQPMTPAGQAEVEGRQFDYPVTQNLNYQPRSMESIGFPELRNFADAYDLLRLVLETRKDQMVKLAWDLAPSEAAKARGVKKISPEEDVRLRAILRKPDGEHTWQQWLRMILEDLNVIDAVAIYPRRTVGGDVVRWDLIDGGTITRLIDGSGRTPLAPDPAYQQIIKGLPTVDYTTQTLVYAPRNVRTNRIYGYSPVEQVIMTAMIGLRRELHQLASYTDGNVPEAIATVPEDWDPKMIEKAQASFDAMLAGNVWDRKKIKFLPAGHMFEVLKPNPLFDQFDEWLIRIICFAFSIAPTAFVKMTNRASAESMQEAALAEGLLPMMTFVEDLINNLIQEHMGMPDVAFQWRDEEDMDPQIQSTIEDTNLRNGSMTLDELRAERGQEPYPDGIGAKPMIYTATGAQYLEEALKPPAPATLPSGGVDPKTGRPLPAGGGSRAGAGGPSAKKKPDAVGKVGGKRVALVAIDRARPARKLAEKKLTKLLRRALAADGAAVAAKAKALLVSHVKPAKKAAGDDADQTDELINEVLAQLELEGFAAVATEVQKTLAELATDGGGVGLAQLGLDDEEALVHDVNQRAVAYAADRTGELITDLDETTTEALRGALKTAVEEGWSGDRLAAFLTGEAFAFSDARADTIARTETARADVAGNLEAYKAGGVTKKGWVLSDDHAVPDECEDNEAAGEIPLDASFPSGDDGPPAHPNCECDVYPVLDDTDPDSEED